MERRWKVLLLISVGSFMAFLDAPVVSVAFPAIHDSFPGTPQTTVAWVLDIYFIAFAGLLVVGGKLADRFGRRTLFMGGMWGFAVSSLACAVAPSAEVLIAARAAQAISAAAVVPAGQGLMLAEFPANERKKAIGALGAIIGLAVALAPTIGGVVVHGLSWRWIFYANVVGGIATIAFARGLLNRDAVKRDAPLPDVLGAVLQAGALALLVFAILRQPAWGIGDARTIGAAVVVGAALVAFVERCRRHRAPIVDLELFRMRNFSVSNLGSLIFAIGLYGMTINIVLFLTSVWHYSVLETGLTFLPAGIFGALFGRPAGQLAEKHGPRIVTAVGAAVAGAGILLIAVSVGEEPHYLRDWLAGSLLESAGLVIGLTGFVGAAVTAVPPAQYALASGVNAAIRQIGGAIGVAVVVAITTGSATQSMFDRAQTAYTVGIAALFLSGIVALAMRSQRGASEEPDMDAPDLRATPASAG